MLFAAFQSFNHSYRCTEVAKNSHPFYRKRKPSVEHPLNLWRLGWPTSPSEGLSCKFRFVLTGAQVSGLLFTTPLPNPIPPASAFAFLSSPGGIAPDKKHQQKTNRFIPKKPASNTQVVFFQVTSKKGWHLPGSV